MKSNLALAIGCALVVCGCTKTLREHLRSNDNLPVEYGLVIPWTGEMYLGYGVTLVDGRPVDGAPFAKRVITPTSQRCFLPLDSSANPNLGEWSSSFKYDAKQGLTVEIPAKCAQAVGDVSAFQNGVFKLESVRVFEGLGHPTTACIAAVPSKPAGADVYETQLTAIYRVAVAKALSLDASAGANAKIAATLTCIEQTNPSAKATFEVSSSNAFSGANLVIASAGTPVKVTSFAARLRKVPDPGTSSVTVFAATEGPNQTAFMGREVPAYLRPVKIIHQTYSAVATLSVQFRVSGVALMTAAPKYGASSCAVVSGDTFGLRDNDSCTLYSQDGTTTLEVSVEKAASPEQAASDGLLTYRLRSYRRDQ